MTLLDLSLSLQGKSYIAGWQDCYSSVQDIYSAYAQIELKNYARPSNWFLIPELNFFDKLYTDQGFEEVGLNAQAVQTGDVLVMNIGRSVNNNHVAVYVGGGQIFHHLKGERSRCEAYGPKWRTRVQYVLRHPKLVEFQCQNQSNVLAGVPHKVKQKLQGGL